MKRPYRLGRPRIDHIDMIFRIEVRALGIHKVKAQRVPVSTIHQDHRARQRRLRHPRDILFLSSTERGEDQFAVLQIARIEQ